MEPFVYLNPTEQSLELMAYVVALTALLKEPIKYLLPKAFETVALVAVAAASGALLNWLLYTFSGTLWLEGLLMGALASGGFKTAKELASYVGTKGITPITIESTKKK